MFWFNKIDTRTHDAAAVHRSGVHSNSIDTHTRARPKNSKRIRNKPNRTTRALVMRGLAEHAHDMRANVCVRVFIMRVYVATDNPAVVRRRRHGRGCCWPKQQRRRIFGGNARVCVWENTFAVHKTHTMRALYERFRWLCVVTTPPGNDWTQTETSQCEHRGL